MPETTAQMLGRYQKELIEQGIPQDIAGDMVRDFAYQIHRGEGVTIAELEPAAMQ